MFTTTDVFAEVELAETRIRPHVRETALEYSQYLSAEGSANVFCKLENLQHTGSFKLRGAMNKILSLNNEQLSKGVIAASTGNHGAAVAYASKAVTTKAEIIVPDFTPGSKIDSIKILGADITCYGNDCVVSEKYARDYAGKNGMTYISPYNDPQIIGGQGTVGIELHKQLKDIDAVFVSLGGGGLISGIAGYLKSVNPKIKIYGCSPENSQVMIQSVKAGKVLDLPSLPTLSEGTAGGVEKDAITFDLCSSLVDDFITVTEDEIKNALIDFINVHHMLIEGAAAMAVASYLKVREKLIGKNIVIVICGANINLNKLIEII